MFWFEYKYMTVSEIMENIKLITDYETVDYIVLIVSIFVVFLLIFFIIPYFEIYVIKKQEEKIKNKKMKMLKRIALQKEVEDQVANELKI